MDMVFKVILGLFVFCQMMPARAQSYIDSCVKHELANINDTLYDHAIMTRIAAYELDQDAICVKDMMMNTELMVKNSWLGRMHTLCDTLAGEIDCRDTFMLEYLDPRRHFYRQKFQYTRHGNAFKLQYYAPVYYKESPEGIGNDVAFYWLKWDEFAPLLDSSQRVLLSSMSALAFRQQSMAGTADIYGAGDGLERYLFDDCLQADFRDPYLYDDFWDSLIHADLAFTIAEGLKKGISCVKNEGFLKGFKTVRGKKERNRLSGIVSKSNILIHPQGSIKVFFSDNGQQCQLILNWADLCKDLMPVTRMLVEKYYFEWK